ncbi:hypothetical protein ND861_15375 [Leptospira sp. 2 VSF19]|uniref:Uncharacterized protein n=1 Tax=Leptospira soteropolitanensis TaxID=2950025 RepID=A0AAW5VS09_9LEPT|nr:hypothetical protein [Leptospira soteropolitanensis]MCW7494027.1 hypothetical protein [Leptospira soteropolitanensis]MCW7501707.1 hypothetical protein [Leptospira soteropolitanensis]MCW7523873.1 hypothetical protein [Leptospira soteropolitanensis]MCW7527738.1 hypothetical protein [Leptospira soteropolitanensis]MCW7531677.1 hypothetical protein [Leptospira soteropolitanensis]
MKKLIFLSIAVFLFGFSLFAQTTPYPKDREGNDIKPEWTPTKSDQSAFGEDEKLKADSLDAKRLPKSTNFWVYGASIGSPASINFNLGYYFKDIVLRGSGGAWGPHWYGGQVDLGYTFWKTPVIAHSISIVGGYFEVNPFAPEVGRGGQSSYPTGVNIPGYNRRDPSQEDLLIRSYVNSIDSNIGTFLEYESRERQRVHLSQRYIGLTYDFLLGNFFLQVGGGVGQGDYKNPQLLLQMGYLFNTREYHD